MTHKVLLSKAAQSDLIELLDFLFAHAPASRASAVEQSLLHRIHSLANKPERGTYPAELLELGNRKYRELVEGKYRVIYAVAPGIVHVHVIADGRRDFRRLLQRRLLADGV